LGQEKPSLPLERLPVLLDEALPRGGVARSDPLTELADLHPPPRPLARTSTLHTRKGGDRRHRVLSLGASPRREFGGHRASLSLARPRWSSLLRILGLEPRVFPNASEAAHWLGIQRTAFSQHFAADFGITWVRLRSGLRLDDARAIVARRPELPMREVADLVG